MSLTVRFTKLWIFERTSWWLAVWIPSTSLWERLLYKVIVSRPAHALRGFVRLDFKAKVLTLDCLPFSLMRIAVGITLSAACDGPRKHFLTSNCGIADWEDLMFWVGDFCKNIAWWNNKFEPELSKTSSQPYTSQNLLVFWKVFGMRVTLVEPQSFPLKTTHEIGS